MRRLLGLLAVAGAGISALGCQQYNNAHSSVYGFSNSSSNFADQSQTFNNSNYRRAQIADRSHNYAEAMHWWMKVIEEGDGLPDVPGPAYRNDHYLSIAIAEGKIGHYYEDGLGVPQDYQKAAYWYQQSINSPSPGYAGAAKERLAFLYAKGLGVPRDRARARALFAASGGLGREAAELVDANELPDDMSGVPSAYAQLKAEKAQKEGEAEEKAAAAEARYEEQHPIAQPAPSDSSASSSPSWFACHHLLGSMGGMMGCTPW